MKIIKRYWLLTLLIFTLIVSASSIGLTQLSTPEPTPLPTLTPTPIPTLTPKLAPTPTPTPTPISTIRDKWLQPFASTSIWNMPIGSNAAYVPAGIQNAGFTTVDINLLYQVPAGSPERPIYDPASFAQRASGTAVADPNRRKTMPIPDNLIVPDATPTDSPNNAAAFLLPDGETLVQLNALARTQVGGPVYGWVYSNNSIYGDGIVGGHGGSCLSSIGGTLRLGELTGIAPIHHALQLQVWAEKYLSYNNDGTRGYRWPALCADSYAGDPVSQGGYGGTNPVLEMGALLALPPSVTAASLGLQTAVGQKLFQALQDYGGYLVDDTAWDAHAISIEEPVGAEVKAAYGYDLEGDSGPMHDDLNKLFTALAVVNNNSARTIGGGGTPRQPLAPRIAGAPADPKPTPTLIGTSTSGPANINLTTEGTTDWAQWPQYNQKASGGSQISNYIVVGSGSVFAFANSQQTMTWSDGTLVANQAGAQTGVAIAGVNNGFQITAPADSTQRTLKVYVGGWNSGGTLTAHLSDGSTIDYVNTAYSSTGHYNVVYTLTYKAAAVGQTLSVKWVQASGSGNVTLQAATLQ